MEPQGAEPVVALAPDKPSVDPGGEVIITATAVLFILTAPRVEIAIAT